MKKLFRKSFISLFFLLVLTFACSTVVSAGVIDDFYYGDHKLRGSIWDADNNTPITVTIGKKKYKGKLRNTRYSISIPQYYKVGTTITVTYKDWDGRVQKDKTKIIKNEDTDVWVYYVYASHTKVNGYVEYAHKGDIIYIKIGNRTYSTVVKKDAKRYKFSLKTKKAKAGTPMRIVLKNRFKQVLVNWRWKVFTSDVVRTGMTKSQVMLLAYWSEPTRKNISAYSEQWCYDDDGDGWTDTYLYFRNGRVSDWYIRE